MPLENAGSPTVVKGGYRGLPDQRMTLHVLWVQPAGSPLVKAPNAEEVNAWAKEHGLTPPIQIGYTGGSHEKTSWIDVYFQTGLSKADREAVLGFIIDSSKEVGIVMN